MTPGDQIFLGATLILSAVSLWWLSRTGLTKPGGLGKGRAVRDVMGVPGEIWFVAAAAAYLAQPFARELAVSLPPDVRGSATSMQFRAVATLSTTIAAALVGVLAALLLRKHAGDKSGLRLWSSERGAAAGGLIVGVLMAPLVLLVMQLAAMGYRLITGAPPSPIAHETLKAITTPPAGEALWANLITLAAVVITPIAEEIMYRGFLQSCILRFTGKAWVSVGVTSALFALVHVSAVPLQALPVLFVVGVALGASFEKSRCLGVPILLHAAFNAANVAAAKLSASP